MKILISKIELILFYIITLNTIIVYCKDQNTSLNLGDNNKPKNGVFSSSLYKFNKHNKNRSYLRINSTQIDQNQPNLLAQLSKVGHQRPPSLNTSLTPRNSINQIKKNLKSKQIKSLTQPKKQIGIDELRDYDPENFIHQDYSFDSKKSFKYSVIKQDVLTNKPVRGLEQLKSIYENLKNGNLVYGDKDINTIRYIPSVKINSNKKVNFLFNLSMLSPSEKILKAELYINKKYIRHRLMFNLHYFLYTPQKQQSETLNQLNKNLNSTTSAATIIDLTKYNKNERFKKHQNWHLFNIIDSLNSYVFTRNNRFRYSNLIKSNSKTNNKVYYTYDQDQNNVMNNLNSGSSQLEEFVLIMDSLKSKRNDLNSDSFDPYLVIYTSEDEEQMKNFFQNRLPPEMLEESVKLLNTVDKDELENLNDYEKLVDNDNKNLQDSLEDKTDSAEIYHASKDSSIRLFENRPPINPNLIKFKLQNSSSSNVYYNYLPKLSDKHKLYDLNRSAQDVEIIFKELKKAKREISNSFEEIESSDFNEKKNSNILNETNDNDANLLLPLSNWKQELNETEIKKEKIKCQTQPITIDFEDMSFSDWIIEPKSFQSSYCSGSCKFPFDKKISFSNYATLQSLLNTIDLSLKNNPPQLCCSPSRTDMLPIIYLDSNSIDYVVKLLPDMIVKECACR